MKKFVKLYVVCLVSLICSATVYSQTVLFNNIEVDPRWVPDPDIKASSVIERGTNARLRWLQLDVDYTTVKNKTGWQDNVVFQYQILLPKSATRRLTVLSGRVEYWSIPMDGEEHHAQAFIHPRILQRYAPGLKMKKNDLKDLRIFITVLVNESAVGKGVYKMKSSTNPRAVEKEVKDALKSMRTVKGNDLIFGRDKTPWGILNTSYYELIKRSPK